MAIGVKRTPEKLAADKARLLEIISSGRTMTSAKEEIGISGEELSRWRRDDLEFELSLASARETQAEAMADSLLSLHETVEDPRKARVASENIRWILERRHRKTYGASVDVNVNASISVTAALAEARSRIVRPMRDPETIDVAVEASKLTVCDGGASDYQSDTPDLRKRKLPLYVTDTGAVPSIGKSKPVDD